MLSTKYSYKYGNVTLKELPCGRGTVLGTGRGLYIRVMG